MQEQNEKFEHWAIVEVFGHQSYAGLVTEQTIGGCSFVRVDVPDIESSKGFTKLFGQGAIYGITVVDEQTAKMKAASLEKKPINEWEAGSLVNKAVEQQMLETISSDDDDFNDDIPL